MLAAGREGHYASELPNAEYVGAGDRDRDGERDRPAGLKDGAALLTKRDRRDIRAFTPVFDGLCPAMTPRFVGNGGRDRDRTCDPYHVKVIPLADYRAKSTKMRA